MATNGGMPTQICLNIFGYVEDGLWHAHALEMDIVGTGETFAAACEEVDSLVRAQISFAAFKGDSSLLWRPAPDEIVARFYDVFIRPGSSSLDSRSEAVTTIGIPPELHQAYETSPALDA